MFAVPSSAFHRAKSGDHRIYLGANLFFLFQQCSSLTIHVLQLCAQSFVFLSKSFAEIQQFADLLFEATEMVSGVIHGRNLFVILVD
jgi:hypothetical protein